MGGPPGVRKDEGLDDEGHHEQRPRRKARREAAEQQRGEEVLGKSRQRHRDRRIERQARKFAAEQIILQRIDPEKTSLDHFRLPRSPEYARERDAQQEQRSAFDDPRPGNRYAPVIKSRNRSEEHTSELQSLMRTSYAVFCLKPKKTDIHLHKQHTTLPDKTHT